MTARERIFKLKVAVYDAGPVPVYAPALQEFADILEMQQDAIERLAVILKGCVAVRSDPFGAYLCGTPINNSIDNLLRELGIEPDGWR